MKSVLTAIIAGAVAFVLVGGVVYEVLLGGFYEANLGSATGVLRDIPVAWALIIGQLGYAAMLTYVFLHAGVRSARGGLKTGALFGLLFGLAIAFDLYAVTNWSTVVVAFVEPFVTAVRFAVAGTAVGWALGRGSGTEAVAPA